MKDKKDKIYYFQEKSNDILDLQDELTVEEILKSRKCETRWPNQVAELES